MTAWLSHSGDSLDEQLPVDLAELTFKAPALLSGHSWSTVIPNPLNQTGKLGSHTSCGIQFNFTQFVLMFLGIHPMHSKTSAKMFFWMNEWMEMSSWEIWLWMRKLHKAKNSEEIICNSLFCVTMGAQVSKWLKFPLMFCSFVSMLLKEDWRIKFSLPSWSFGKKSNTLSSHRELVTFSVNLPCIQFQCLWYCESWSIDVDNWQQMDPSSLE